MKRELKSKLVLQAAFIIYLIGCALWYFFWYKNGQISRIAMITLVIGSICVFISEYKTSNVIFKRLSKYKTLFVVFFIVISISVAGIIHYLAKKRVDQILHDGPTEHAVATVIDVDMRSMRSGKQAWSIINYNATGTTIEQSFADTSSNLMIGNKYLIEYSLKYPDMFRILRKVK
jgi:hypothetical protein